MALLIMYQTLAMLLVIGVLPIAAALSQEEQAARDRIAGIFLTTPAPEVYDRALKVILEVMDSPLGTFGYIDEAGAFVVPSLTAEAWWPVCKVKEKGDTFPRAEWRDSSWPTAIREQRPIMSNERSTLTPEGHLLIDRHISMPIIFQHEVVGLIQVANKPTDYDAADLARLQGIANYIAPILNERLQKERAVVLHAEAVADEAEADERADSLSATVKWALALAFSVVIFAGGVVFKLGRAQKTIEHNAAGVAAAHNSIGVAEEKHDADVAALRSESHECRTTIHGELRQVRKDIGDIGVGVAEIRGAARMWHENNGPSGPTST